MDSVLVLNKHLLAIQVTDTQSAVCALVSGRARVIDETYTTYDLSAWIEKTKQLRREGTKLYHKLLRSPSIAIYAPQVIIIPDCLFNNTMLKSVRYSRQNIYKRDSYRCAYCKDRFDHKSLTIDHIVPRSRGGQTSWTNIVACCRSCNAKKKDHTPEELGWTRPFPKEPAWTTHIGLPFDKVKRSYWSNFLRE